MLLSTKKVFDRFRAIRVLSKIRNFELPEKLKGGRVEKWLEFWKAIGQDYRDVIKDVVKESREKPFKSITILSATGFFTYAIASNPDEQSFQNRLVVCSQRLLLVSEALRNPVSDQHVQMLNQAYAQGNIRRLNCAFLSLMWVDNYNPDCCLYEAQCTYLKPKYTDFYRRIVDVGFLGRWLNLDRKMVDYDVNPDEWKHEENS